MGEARNRLIKGQHTLTPALTAGRFLQNGEAASVSVDGAKSASIVRRFDDLFLVALLN
jgi:hypothetical protein